MGGFGDEIMVRASTALGRTGATLEQQLAARRWIEHNADMLAYLAVWARDVPYADMSAANMVLPEIACAHERLRGMLPDEYWRLDMRRWQDFVVWCRTNPPSEVAIRAEGVRGRDE